MNQANTRRQLLLTATAALLALSGTCASAPEVDTITCFLPVSEADRGLSTAS